MNAKENDNSPDKELIKSQNNFPVVGIGASAGGLDAFKKLLTAIPEDSGMAYVLVQHLHPGHESFLAEILQKVTKMGGFNGLDSQEVKDLQMLSLQIEEYEDNALILNNI